MSLLIHAIAYRHGLKKTFVEKAWRESKKIARENGKKGNYSECVHILKEKLGLDSNIALPEKEETTSLNDFTLKVVETNSNVTLCRVEDCPEVFKKHINEKTLILIRSEDLKETTSSCAVGSTPGSVSPKKKRKKKKKTSLYDASFSNATIDEMLEQEIQKELKKELSIDTEHLIEESNSSCGFCRNIPCNCTEIVESMTETVEFDNNLTPKELKILGSAVSGEELESPIGTEDKISLQQPPKILRNENTGDSEFGSVPTSPTLDTDSGANNIEDLAGISDGKGEKEEDSPEGFDDFEKDLEDEEEEDVSLETENLKDEDRDSIQYKESIEDKKEKRINQIHETLFGTTSGKKVNIKKMPREKLVESPKRASKENSDEQAQRLSDFFGQF